MCSLNAPFVAFFGNFVGSYFDFEAGSEAARMREIGGRLKWEWNVEEAAKEKKIK